MSHDIYLGTDNCGVVRCDLIGYLYNHNIIMISFLIALGVLIGGYLIYGVVVERVFKTDAGRVTPAISMRDGVDYVPMATWRVFMIQFLNIAGLGPIFGAIMGIMFGPAAFLWIALGTIFAGATHDFIAAMISLRRGGLSLPECVGEQLGNGVRQTMRGFSVILLVLVAAVFVITPAGIIDGMIPGYSTKMFWVAVIFIYYMLATLLPVDKVIGKLYPVFGFALLFMAVGLLVVLLVGGHDIPVGFDEGLFNRQSEPDKLPIFPMMFVSIACGAISGFHATQSPMMARCLKNERLARPVFYGAMVAEGIVALIWAAAAIAFTGGYEELHQYVAMHGDSAAGDLVSDISRNWLGVVGGFLALLGVVVAPITSGDTALRSARLIVADFLHIDQSKIKKRILTALPLFLVSFMLMLIDFNVLWRYFAWCNQTLAVFTLWAATVYLARNGRMYIITLLPAIFMTVVSVSYILFAPNPEGFGVNLGVAILAGIVVAALFTALFHRFVSRMHRIDVGQITGDAK